MARSDSVQLHLDGVQPVQILAGIAGLLFVLGSGLGFVFGTPAGQPLGLTLTPFRLLVYFAAGAIGLICATVSALSRAYGWLLFFGGALTFVWGMMVNGVIAPVVPLGNPLALDVSDALWHLGAAVAGLPIAILPARKAVPRDEFPGDRWSLPA